MHNPQSDAELVDLPQEHLDPIPKESPDLNEKTPNRESESHSRSANELSTPVLGTLPTLTTDETPLHPLAALSPFKKHILLLVFSVSTFLDICNVSGAGLAVPEIARDIGLGYSQLSWIITSYSLTFASFLLFAGRLSDLFSAAVVFEVGFIGLGAMSLITSFVTTSKFGFLILRGLGGVFGAMTIPSAYHLLVHMFPESEEQQKKLAILGMAGGIGNVLGSLLAGITMLASYHWFFRLVAIMAFTFSGIGLVLLPKMPSHQSTVSRWRLLDLPGVVLMIGFLICFILSLTQGPIDGWDAVAFIAPFIISIICEIGFFVWEYKLPPRTAILPRHVWKVTNFTTSSLAILIPLGFWFTSQLLYATYWQVAFRWRPIHVSAAMLPQGIAGLLVGAAAQFIPQIVARPRITLPTGVAMILIAEVLQVYSYGGRGHDGYWKYCFPAFVIGSSGAMLVYFASAINIIAHSPPEMSGVISAWTQVVAQIEASVTLAVQSAFEDALLHSWMRSAGRTFWFIFAWATVLGVQYVVCYRQGNSPLEEHENFRRRVAEHEDAQSGSATLDNLPVLV